MTTSRLGLAEVVGCRRRYSEREAFLPDVRAVRSRQGQSGAEIAESRVQVWRWNTCGGAV
jgi:hypothetical protein